MAVHGFNITPEIERLAFEHAGTLFNTYRIQAFIEKTYIAELSSACKAEVNAHRYRLTQVEIAMRVADKLVQKWKKQGKIALGHGRQWNKV